MNATPVHPSLRMFTVVVPATGGTFELGDRQQTPTCSRDRSRAGQNERTQDSVVQVQPSVFVDLADTLRGSTALRRSPVLIESDQPSPAGTRERDQESAT